MQSKKDAGTPAAPVQAEQEISADDKAGVAPELRPAGNLGDGSDQKVDDSPILESGRSIVFDEASGKGLDVFAERFPAAAERGSATQGYEGGVKIDFDIVGGAKAPEGGPKIDFALENAREAPPLTAGDRGGGGLDPKVAVFEETRLDAGGDPAGKAADAFKGEVEGIKATVVEDSSVSAFREYATRKAANPADEPPPDLVGSPGKPAYDGKDAAAPAAEAFSARSPENAAPGERPSFDNPDQVFGRADSDDGPETLGYSWGESNSAKDDELEVESADSFE